MSLSRRFHLAPGFARLIGREHPANPVVEGHFPDQSDRRSFVRLEGDGCTLVLEDRTHTGEYEEERSEVSRAQGEILLDVCAGKAIYERIPFHGSSGMSLEVTRFVAPMLAAFIEVRFGDKSEAEAFRPPLWFGPELAQEESCAPRAIALGRRPKQVDTTIQNAALEALIDHLDARSGRGGVSRGLDDPLMGTLRRLMRAPEQVTAARPAKPRSVPAQSRGTTGDDDQVFEAATAAASRGTSAAPG
ncbi:MAG: hypothetical protein ACXIVE_18680 [Salinarimonas sp.]